MPPRIPVVFAVVAIYAAVAFTGGATALREVAIVFDGARLAPEFWRGALTLSFTYADFFALVAAVAALPDAALRPSRGWADRVAGLLCLGGAIGVAAASPSIATPAYAVLVALLLGDWAAGLGGWRPRRGPRPG